MMIKKVILIFICVFGLSISAQTKDELMEIVANETCECINKEDPKLSNKEIEMKLGICMLKSYNKRKEIFQKYNIKFDSEESGEKIGREIGILMASICPDFFLRFVEDVSNTEIEKSIEGEIISISGDDFNFVKIKDESGKVRKFLWLRNFEGASKLIEKGNSNSKVIIHFESIECYLPKMDGYYNLNEITKIEYL